jgi:hypothetical protein
VGRDFSKWTTTTLRQNRFWSGGRPNRNWETWCAARPAELLAAHVAMLIKVAEASQAAIESDREAKH